jgi:hypothetical protein
MRLAPFVCVALLSCTPAQTANDVTIACQVFEKTEPVTSIIAELVDLTGVDASQVVAAVDAFCQANGTTATQQYLQSELTLVRAAHAKALLPAAH